MELNEIVNLVQRANNVQETSRAAMLIEHSREGELQISTYGNPFCVGFMKKKLRKLLNNE